MKKKIKKAPFIIIILVIITIIVAVQFIYVVREDEQVVLIEFGRIIGVENVGNEPNRKSDAGLHWKAPWVSALKFSKKIQRWNGDPDTIPTKPDNQEIFIDTTARWRISNPETFYKTLGGNLSEAAGRLDDLVDGAVRNIIRGSYFNQVVSSDSDIIEEYFKSDNKLKDHIEKVKINGKIKGRDELANEILKVVKNVTLESFGIEILDVIIKRVDYIDENRQAAYRRMIEERKKVSGQKIALGQGKAIEIAAEMNKYIKIKKSEAYAKAEEEKGKGDAEAAKTYAEAYTNNPQDTQRGLLSKEKFYEFYKMLESYESLSGDSEITISTDSDFFRLLKDMNSSFK